MRIFFDGYPFLKNGKGGVARYTLGLTRAIRRECGDAVVSLCIPRGSKFPPAGEPYFEEGGLRAFYERRRADIFHTFWYRMPASLHGARPVTTVYDWIDEALPLYKINKSGFVAHQRKVIAASSGLVAISEDVKRRTMELTGFPGDRIAVAPPFPGEAFTAPPPCADDAAAFRLRVTKGAPFLLHVGSRGLYKNFTTVLRAFLAAAPRTDRHLVVVGGEPSLTEDEVFHVARAGCLGRVHLLRRISDADLRVAYAAADAYVSASHMEGFGIPVVEALACGTQPLLSDIPVYREVAGDFARYAPTVDVDAWTALFESAAMRPVGGRDSVLSRYSAKASADAVIGLYGKIL